MNTRRWKTRAAVGLILGCVGALGSSVMAPARAEAHPRFRIHIGAAPVYAAPPPPAYYRFGVARPWRQHHWPQYYTAPPPVVYHAPPPLYYPPRPYGYHAPVPPPVYYYHH